MDPADFEDRNREASLYEDEHGKKFIMEHPSGDSHHPDAYRVYLDNNPNEVDNGDPSQLEHHGEGHTEDGHWVEHEDPRHNHNAIYEDPNENDDQGHDDQPQPLFNAHLPGGGELASELDVSDPGRHQANQHQDLDKPTVQRNVAKSGSQHGNTDCSTPKNNDSINIYDPSMARISPMDSRYYQQPKSVKMNRKGVVIVDNDLWIPQAKVDHVNRGYKPSGGNVPIVDEKLTWAAQPRIEAHNPEYKRSGGNVTIHTEKLKWTQQPRIDAKNKEYKPGGGNVVILHENLRWRHQPSVDAKNTNYKPNQSDVTIFNDKLQWKAEPKLSTRNNSYEPQERQPVPIIDEKLSWHKKAKVDHVRPYYVPGGGHVIIQSDQVQLNSAPKMDHKNNGYVPHLGEVKIPVSKLDLNTVAAAKVDTLSNAQWKPSVDNVYFDAVKKRWVANARAAVSTAQSDSYVADKPPQSPDTLSERTQVSKKTQIVKAPQGTSWMDMKTKRNTPNAYGELHKSHGRAVPHFLPPLEYIGTDTGQPKKVLFQSKDLVNADIKNGSMHPAQAEAKISKSILKVPAETGLQNIKRKPTPRDAGGRGVKQSPTPRKPGWKVKPKIEVFDTKDLEQGFKRAKPVVDSPSSYSTEYIEYDYDTPLDPSPASGYNFHHQGRENLRTNNKFTDYHVNHPVPNNKGTKNGKVY